MRVAAFVSVATVSGSKVDARPPLGLRTALVFAFVRRVVGRCTGGVVVGRCTCLTCSSRWASVLFLLFTQRYRVSLPCGSLRWNSSSALVRFCSFSQIMRCFYLVYYQSRSSFLRAIRLPPASTNQQNSNMSLIRFANSTCRKLFTGPALKAPIKAAASKPLGAKSTAFAPSFNALPLSVRREIHSAMRSTSTKGISPKRLQFAV